MRFIVFCLVFLSVVAEAWDFSYDLNMEQVKETTTMTNSFSASTAISPTTSINGNSSFSAKRTAGLNQFNDSRNASGWINWRPIDGVEMSTTLSKNISLEDRFGDRVRDDRTESASGSIRYSSLRWLTANVSVGLLNRDYVYESGSGNNDGTFYRINNTINKTIFSDINTSLNFSENRTYGNETNLFSNAVSSRMSYYFPEKYMGGSLSAEVSGKRNTVEYLDSLVNHLGDSWSYSEHLELPVFLPGLYMDFGTSWSFQQKYWEYADPDSSMADPRNDENLGRSLSSNLAWEISDNIEINFSFLRSLTEREHYIDVYAAESYKLNENTDDKLLDITLMYTPGAARVVFQKIVELYSYDTIVDDGDSSSVYTHDFDRDEYRDLLSISASIPLSSRFTATTAMSGQQRSSYYLKASQSANSNTASTYSFAPGYRYDLGNNWNITQNVKITANYTKYIFEETRANDRLFRRLDESFSLLHLSTDSTTFGISHRFTFSDQGTFEDNLYLRSEESFSNRVTFDSGFHVSASVGLTPSYSYEYAFRNRIALSLKTIDHIHRVGIRSSIKVMGGTMSTNITRTFYGNSSRESYWNATVGFNVRM